MLPMQRYPRRVAAHLTAPVAAKTAATAFARPMSAATPPAVPPRRSAPPGWKEARAERVAARQAEKAEGRAATRAAAAKSTATVPSRTPTVPTPEDPSGGRGTVPPPVADRQTQGRRRRTRQDQAVALTSA